jgi:hypothetical protein
VDSPAASACRTAMLFFVHKPIRKTPQAWVE